jgi:hypothetical protein
MAVATLGHLPARTVQPVTGNNVDNSLQTASNSFTCSTLATRLSIGLWQQFWASARAATSPATARNQM